jgi:hypothetical protein
MADNQQLVGAGGIGFGAGALLVSLMKKGASGSDADLLAAISAALDKEQQTLQAILDALQMGGSTGNAVAVPNRDTASSVRIVVSAANLPIRLPHFFIPDTFELKIKAGFANAGQVYVAETAANSVNINQSEELVRGEFTLQKIKDAYALWISGTNAGDYIVLTAEQ